MKNLPWIAMWMQILQAYGRLRKKKTQCVLNQEQDMSWCWVVVVHWHGFPDYRVKLPSALPAKAEYIALSTTMRDCLPTRALLKENGDKMQLSYCHKSKLLSRVWEDNNGAIQSAEDATKKVTFWTKHIAVKYHFFWEHLNDEITVQKVNTTNQIADLFTKDLAAPQFEYLASKLMGWNFWEHYSSMETVWMRWSDAG